MRDAEDPQKAMVLAGTDPPPWEDWRLDKKFLTSLTIYNEKHPESTLDRVLDGIVDGLKDQQPLINLIPDSPFPARGLVGALSHLIQLGITVTRAQATVRDFSEQVITWVMEIQAAFSATVGGHFTWATWKNLERMRGLVDEICRWANARLNDKRWNRIGNGMMIAKEISEFNTQITEARNLFTDLTLINLSGGIDAVVGAIRLLLQRQDTISQEIQKIKERQKQQFTYIINEIEAQKQADARREFFSQTLSPHVVANPTYDQQGKQPCDENTRTQVLADIKEWVNDTSASSQNFLWLTGDPGCGKSAITASLARGCKDEEILWAQFFINRNNVETTDPNSYFPSIAQQLMHHSVDVELKIHKLLKRKPSLMDKISPDQAANLFIDAIAVASELDSGRPVVVVIDGLDETDRSRLKDTAIIFSHLFKSLSNHHNVKVFVSSRTEDDIRNPFSRAMDEKHVKHIHLDTSAQSSIDDVSEFLKKKIAQIVEDNDLNWEEWPGERRMRLLCQKASGLFIWAVTVTKFLQEQIDTMGTECLNDILDVLNAEALSDINVLYSVILKQTHGDQTSDWEFQKFRHIIGAIVVLCEPLCLEDLGILLDLKQSPSHAPVDIVNFVRRLRTVLVSGTQAIDKTTIPRIHKSFFEFITSPKADPRCRIDSNAANREVGIRCISRFRNAHGVITFQPSKTLSTLPKSLRYAFRFWSLHLQKSGSEISGVIMEDHPSLQGNNLHELLKHCSSRLAPLHMFFSPDQSQIFTASGDHLLAWDASSGRETKTPLTVLEGHRDYVSSLAFSPDGTRIVSGSADKIALVWDVETGQPVATLDGHGGRVLCVAYSPTGGQIATSSDDSVIRVWDAKTHTLTSTLNRHTKPVRSFAFSPNGKQIVSGSDDTTVLLWNLEDSSCTPILQGHSRAITSVAHSPQGRKLVSSSDDNTVRFWDMDTNTPLGEPVHFSNPNGLQFSPQGTYIAACVAGNTIYLWHTKKAYHNTVVSAEKLSPSVRRICSLTFSPDERSLILGCDDQSVRVVELPMEPDNSFSLTGHRGWVMSVAVSSDGRYLASGSVDKTVRIWSLITADSKVDTVDDQTIPFTSFSQDGRFVVWVATDGTLRLWKSASENHLGRILPGLAGEIETISFSPTGSRVAGLSAETSIYLWDTTTCCLIATSVADYISRPISLYFVPDDEEHFITIYPDSSSYVWEEKDGKLVGTASNDVTLPLQLLSLHSLAPDLPSVDRDGGLRGFQWVREMESGTGIWMFLREHIIRAREDGSITIAHRQHE